MHHERARVGEPVGEGDVLGARLRLVLVAPVQRDDHRVGVRGGRAHVLDRARRGRAATPARQRPSPDGHALPVLVEEVRVAEERDPQPAQPRP